MDLETRQFIENATLLFIASRNAKGMVDVSPRGGQPSVVRVTDDGTLLLPDYSGNRRLDTIANLLTNPNVALLIVNRGCDRYLHITAQAAVSFLKEDLLLFPADENPALSVLVLQPKAIEFAKSEAFARGDFWADPTRRKPPLDLVAIIGEDQAANTAAGSDFVPRDGEEEHVLAAAGVRGVYAMPSALVLRKVGQFAGPAGLRFLEKATFVVIAHDRADGEVAIGLAGEAPVSVVPSGNTPVYRLQLPSDVSTGARGECALLVVVPGQNELLRINGRFEREAGALTITSREVFFHCSAAFSRARIWQQDRRKFWSGKRRFICVERHRESPDVTSFVLKPFDNAPIGPVLPGQYITVSLPDENGTPRQRSYSVSRRPDGKTLRISVRRIGAGGVSDLLHDTAEPGTEILVGSPAGRFVLSTPPGRPIVFLSAGVGVTPLLPMLEEVVGEDSGREVLFVHAARDGAHHLFEGEARAIAARAKNGGIRLVSCYSRPRPEDACDLSGRIDAAAIARMVQVKEADFYICGPSAFMMSLRDGLIAHGAAPEAIKIEAFEASAGAAFEVPGRAIASASTVAFAKSGKTAVWSPSEGSLLDLALKNGVDVAYSCRMGDCGSCVQNIVSGLVDYPGGEVPLLAYGQVLLCQAIPQGDLVVDC
ncbi:pyridoxamine 5'-phosphate oxidase family protein [Shinella sp. BYT-45]|uniref:pyridoxamine 5'-phosphate oxidase family protein n=1 Tax=Shinella sp. BYT-45 TaxID=3377377 RepID=UPI00397F7EDB